MQNFSTQVSRRYLAVGSVLAAFVAFALAVDPTPDGIATAGTTGLVTGMLTTLNTVWPLLVVVFASLIGIGLVIKVTRKAVSDSNVKHDVRELA